MIRHTFVEEFGFTYLLVSAPFDLEELYTLLANVPTDPIPPEALCPVLLDLREVDLDHLSEADIRRHLMRKSTLDPRLTHVPCAYVVRDARDAMVVRLATVYADLSGVGTETKSLVTEHLTEAVGWLVHLTGAGNAASAQVQEDALIAAAVPVT